MPLSQGWDKTQTIDSLLRKGGFKGVVTPDVRRSIRLVRYQSERLTVSYQDYLHHCRYGLTKKSVIGPQEMDITSDIDKGNFYVVGWGRL